jgi:hypothetical protein
MRVAQGSDAIGSKKYLKENIVGITETVNPQYCLCVNQMVISINKVKLQPEERKFMGSSFICSGS